MVDRTQNTYKLKTASKTRTILVTGANGQLGMTFQKYEKDYPSLNLVFCSSKELDITNQLSIEKAFEKYKPDYCINCAAYTNVEKAEEEPEKAFGVNAEGVKNLAEVCEPYNTILIHISTDYVFDGEKNAPYTVKDIPNPINEYGKAKLQGEKYIQEILKNYFIVRTSWLYSKEFGKNFYRTILKKAKTEKELYVVDNQIGCPTDTENLQRFLLNIILTDNREFGIFHFTDQKIMSWYDFAKIIIQNNNLQDISVIKSDSFKTKAKRPKYSALE